MNKRKLIWIGDAAVSSGFARCTHNILDVVQETWDVFVLGLNYQGDPHGFPYPIYPCGLNGGDFFGLNRIGTLVDKIRPDLIVVQNDPWNIPAYLQRAGNVPVIAIMPVDGKNCAGNGLNGLNLAIFWTEFGLKEAKLGGYAGRTEVIPLGVNLEIYKPQKGARQRLGLPASLEKAFIVGNVNRNQPRKRLDLTVAYFAEWIKEYDVQDAYLFLHVAPTGDLGYDVSQLMYYYGLSNKLIIAEPEIGHGIAQTSLAATYSVFDVQLTTTQGEGWGLTTMEGMACGVPQIVPDWAALGEWAKPSVMVIPCNSTAVTPNKVNVIGGIIDREPTIKALDMFYRDKHIRENLSQKGLELVGRSEYRWENIGEKFAEAFDSIGYNLRNKKCK